MEKAVFHNWYLQSTDRFYKPISITVGESVVLVIVNSSLMWGFQTDTHPEASDVAHIYRAKDTIGIKLIYETANPFFYTNLVNQLPANGFAFRQTLTKKNNVTLLFSNGKQELLLDVAQADGTDKPYRITLQPVNPMRTSLPHQYNHKVRLNAY